MTKVNQIEAVKRKFHYLKEFAGSIGLIVIGLFMLSQIILITLNGGVYWYENKWYFLVGDFLVCAGTIWLGIDRLRDDLNRE